MLQTVEHRRATASGGEKFAEKKTAKKIIVTGGAGFIGSALSRHAMLHTDHDILVIDKLTYAGNLESLADIRGNSRFTFVQADISNAARMKEIIERYQPDAIMHLAAESHVDRSIDRPDAFIQTNVVGTFSLLHAALHYWKKLPAPEQAAFRFHHVSTDEVFGSLREVGTFCEGSPYDPRSPYSATKAASDHLARAWFHTYGLPVVVTNCSNNYGPSQFPEKLIPLTIINALHRSPLPVYGNGSNVRDWLYVEDHARALLAVAERGRPGETYCVGGNQEIRNVDVVRTICRLMDELRPDREKHERLIAFVTDRPGHDQRYAIDASKIKNELEWEPLETFETGLRKTVQWYLNNRAWWDRIRSGVYRGERLGVVA